MKRCLSIENRADVVVSGVSGFVVAWMAFLGEEAKNRGEGAAAPVMCAMFASPALMALLSFCELSTEKDQLERKVARKALLAMFFSSLSSLFLTRSLLSEHFFGPIIDVQRIDSTFVSIAGLTTAVLFSALEFLTLPNGGRMQKKIENEKEEKIDKQKQGCGRGISQAHCFANGVYAFVLAWFALYAEEARNGEKSAAFPVLNALLVYPILVAAYSAYTQGSDSKIVSKALLAGLFVAAYSLLLTGLMLSDREVNSIPYSLSASTACASSLLALKARECCLGVNSEQEEEASSPTCCAT